MSSSMSDVAGVSAAPASARSASSRYTYAVTAQPPTLVTQTAVCSFTHAADKNLLLVRSSRLEIYKVTVDGLENILEVPIYGRVTALVVTRAKVSVQNDTSAPDICGCSMWKLIFPASVVLFLFVCC